MDQAIQFDWRAHEFTTATGHTVSEASASAPLSVIVQVTRRCQLSCSFCSESQEYPDPSFAELETLCGNLQGVRRIYLSGGEPLLRDDIFDLIDMYRARFPVVGLPTNCLLVSPEVAKRLRGTVSYVNAGLDGPPAINNRVRGGYDQIIAGIGRLRDSAVEVSLSTVVLGVTLPYLEYVVAVADAFGVKKTKFAMPVPRGRAISLQSTDLVSREAAEAKFRQLVSLKELMGWRPRVKLTFWDASTEGYAILVYPNQDVYAWPVPSQPDSVAFLGSLRRMTLADIWHVYPYKLNHIRKYVGHTMLKA